MYEARRAWRLETSGEEQQLMTDGSKREERREKEDPHEKIVLFKYVD